VILDQQILVELCVLCVYKQWTPRPHNDPSSRVIVKKLHLVLLIYHCHNFIHDLLMTCLQNSFVDSHLLKHLCLYVDVHLLAHLHLNLKSSQCFCFIVMHLWWNNVIPTSKLPSSCFLLQCLFPLHAPISKTSKLWEYKPSFNDGVRILIWSMVL
jgi:hypothetical protein